VDREPPRPKTRTTAALSTRTRQETTHEPAPRGEEDARVPAPNPTSEKESCAQASLQTRWHQGGRRTSIPRSSQPHRAIIRIAATCVCGVRPWEYSGNKPVGGDPPIGHEYVGSEETGGSPARQRPVVIGSFVAPEGTCPILPGRITRNLLTAP